MKSKTLALMTVCALAAGAFACSNSNPAAPVAPDPNTGGATLKATAPTPQSPTNDAKMTSSVVVLTASAATLQFQPTSPVTLQYRFQVQNGSNVVDDALVGEPTYQVKATLADSTRHTWRVRAEAQGEVGPWSPTASFVTQDPALITDPLTNGRTTGRQIGGRFVDGVGWQSTSTTSAIEYNIPTCDDCTIEFDLTNVGKAEGVCCNADLKILSMGDGNTFGDFNAFRDHEWKMHLNQRGDGDGTGLEIIWRNGGTSVEGNPGDHRIKMNGGGPDFRDSSVFHFVVRWSPSGYNISVGTNGGEQVEYLEDGFGGLGYAPPNHTIQLGCVPRAESFPSAIYRNVRIYRN